jgi:hypothetical protein
VNQGITRLGAAGKYETNTPLTAFDFDANGGYHTEVRNKFGLIDKDVLRCTIILHFNISSEPDSAERPLLSLVAACSISRVAVSSRMERPTWRCGFVFFFRRRHSQNHQQPESIVGAKPQCRGSFPSSHATAGQSHGLEGTAVFDPDDVDDNSPQRRGPL